MVQHPRLAPREVSKGTVQRVARDGAGDGSLIFWFSTVVHELGLGPVLFSGRFFGEDCRSPLKDSECPLDESRRGAVGPARMVSAFPFPPLPYFPPPYEDPP